jgi:hypothetical protein
MGLFKSIKKTVSNVTKPITKVVTAPVKALVKAAPIVAKVPTKVIQTAVKAVAPIAKVPTKVMQTAVKVVPRILAAPLTGGASLVAPKAVIRSAVAVAAPLTALVAPGLTMGAGLVIQPKTIGITNADNAKLFDKSQQVARIAAATGAVVGGAVLAAPAVAAALTTGGTGVAATFGKDGLELGKRLLETGASALMNGKLGDTLDDAKQRQDQVTQNKAGRPAITATAPSGLPPWVWPVGAAVAVIGVLVLRK